MRPSLRRLLGALIPLVLALAFSVALLARTPAHEERDVVQERLDKASVPLGPGHALGQTFLSRHAGLKAVELLLVVYDESRELPPTARIVLTLERLDKAVKSPIRVELGAQGLKHNQRVRFAFAPLADSRYATYRLTLSCDADYGLGFWHTTSDAYAYGEMWDGPAKGPGDLYFTTIYDYRPLDALKDIGSAARRYGRYLAALLVLLFLPGLVLCLYFLPAGRCDVPSYLALALALSLAAWPLLLLWASAPGVSLAGGGAWGIIAVLLVAGLYGGIRKARSQGIAPDPGQGLAQGRRPRADYLPDVALVVVLLLTLATRLLHVRELVVPAWVDSLHHTLITQLISEQGVVPTSYQPYLPPQDFNYHFGFHANAAVLTWLTGLPAYQAVLLLGQVLNMAAALVAYAGAACLTRNRWAGVASALFAGLLSSMPAYYVSWGRYTQLTGLLLLPLLCRVTSWLLAAKSTGRGVWVIGVILAGGLALTHYRVLIFYSLFVLAYIPLSLWRVRRVSLGAVEVLLAALALAALAVAAIFPWVARFLVRVIPRVGETYGGWASAEGTGNALSMGILDIGWGRSLLYIAGAGAIWGLLRRKGEVIVLLATVGLCFLIANLRLLGLADIWLIHNEAVMISLWLPMSLLCSWLVGDVLSLLGRGLRHLPKRLPGEGLLRAGLLSVTVVLACWGGWHLVDVLNPVTVLVTPDDLRAIEWVAENTPPEARFLINTGKWMQELRMGTDAGWWLPLLAKRQVTLPSVLYAQSQGTYREAVNDLARTVEESESLDDAALRERLAREGVTHVFVGARGGRLMPQDLDPSPYYRLRYATGPVRVYEFVGMP